MMTTFNDGNYKYSCNLFKLKYTAVVMTPNFKYRKSGSILKNKRDKKKSYSITFFNQCNIVI